MTDPEQTGKGTGAMAQALLRGMVANHPLPWECSEEDGIGCVRDANGAIVTSSVPPQAAFNLAMVANDLRAEMDQSRQWADVTAARHRLLKLVVAGTGLSFGAGVLATIIARRVFRRWRTN